MRKDKMITLLHIFFIGLFTISCDGPEAVEPDMKTVSESIAIHDHFFGLIWPIGYTFSYFVLNSINRDPFIDEMSSNIGRPAFYPQGTKFFAGGIIPEKKTRFLYTEDKRAFKLLAGETLVIDNATSFDVKLKIDSKEYPEVLSYSHVKICLTAGLHTLSMDNKDLDRTSSQIIDLPEGSEIFILNIDTVNSYYISVKYYVAK